MRPGITIQHARELSQDGEFVRSDITGMIGVVPRDRWPRGAARGDFIELPLTSWAELSASRILGLFDPVTVQAVRQFFLNGGVSCRLIGLCVTSEDDLMSEQVLEETFGPLLDRLRAEEDIGLLAMPALAYLPVTFDRLGRAEVRCQPTVRLLIEHCREMNNRFFVLDAPEALHDEPLIQWVAQLQEVLGPAASFAALYYPWLQSGDERFPPSGSVAGIFARVEHEHAPFGVRWPPANSVIHGATHPVVPIRWRESDQLIAAHVNPILTQPTRGGVVWGARTLSRDPRWMHINSRRIVSMISEQIRRDSAWVVFEHQRPELWKIVERTVRSRLDAIWSAGLLTGEKAGMDYEVSCNEELNPLAVRDAGQVHVRILLRPISTAESIVVELQLGR